MFRIAGRSLGLVATGAILACIARDESLISFHRVTGAMASELGFSDAAGRHLELAVQGSRERAAETFADDLLAIAAHYRETDRPEASRNALEQAIAIYPDDLGFDRPRRSMILLALIDVYEDLGLLDEALASARDLLRLAEDRLGTEHLLVAGVLDSLSNLHSQRGDLKSAERLQRRALSIREAKLGAEHPDVAGTMTRLGRLLANQGDTLRARLYLEQSVDLLRRVAEVSGQQVDPLFVALNELGGVYQQEGRDRLAWLHFKEALALPVGESPERVALLVNASNTLLRLGRFREALRYSEVALESEAGIEMPQPMRLSLVGDAEHVRLEAIRSLETSSDPGWVAGSATDSFL